MTEFCPEHEGSGWICERECAIAKLRGMRDGTTSVTFGNKPSDGTGRDGSKILPGDNFGRNSWEAGVVKDDRGLPILDSKGSRIRMKEWSENRALRDEYRRLKSGEPISQE